MVSRPQNQCDTFLSHGTEAQEDKAEGKCIFETMDGILTPTSFTDKSLHLMSTKSVVRERKPGIAIVSAPANLTTDVKSVEMYQEALPEVW
ncbi:elongation factor 1-alpha-like [Culex pipiens pallens]|uniref:elongation factor 1-alpha-like n=1 Tax=Culex pipiens pallens TaxID=42434 RepID=UPI00195302E3|nr:elongation factor 1-alpha-like [Culex pipiens pallens]